MATIAMLASAAGCSFSTTTNVNGDGPIDANVPLETSLDDIDGDGVMNAADNCPMIANPGQYNEDGDSTGDECDPCPQLGTAAADLDSDGDLVGNGCDPHPGTPGDALAYWNGFHVASRSLPAGLSVVHGSADRWSVAGGFLVFDRTGDDWGMPVVDVGKANHTIDANFDITAIFSGAAAAGVAVDVAANDTDNFLCQARNDNQRREMWRRNPSALDGWSAIDSVSANTPVDTYRIRLERTATDLSCTTTRLGQISVSITDSSDSASNTRAALFARNVDARFRYIAVYTSP